MKKRNLLFAGLASLALCGSANALSITVDPVGGALAGNPTTTIADALSQIAASGDTSHTISLVDGSHNLGVDETWTIPTGETVDFVAVSGRPTIVLANGTGRYMLQIFNPLGSTLTITSIDIVPPTGLTYGNNADDGIQFSADATQNFAINGGTYVFTDVVFGANDGSGAAAVGDYSTYTNLVGDDWIQFNGGGDVTFDACVITGAFDDGILYDGDGFSAPANPAKLNFINGTAIVNNGGAGVQMFGGQTDINSDGTGGRIVIANNGQRTGAADAGFKSFASAGYRINFIDTDIVGNSIGGFLDYSYTSEVNFINSRVAQNNSSDTLGGANIAFLSTQAQTATVGLYNSTIHDNAAPTPANGFGVLADDTGLQVEFIIDRSIFSGTADQFDLNDGDGATFVTTNGIAVPTAGPDAPAGAGDLAPVVYTSDPAYTSTVFDATPGADNSTYLLPTGTDYTANTVGALLNPNADINTWTEYTY